MRVLKHYLVYLSADAPIEGNLEPELYPCDTEEDVKKKAWSLTGGVDDYYGHWTVMEDGSINRSAFMMEEIEEFSSSLWDGADYNTKIRLLAGRTGLFPSLLLEMDEVVQMIKDGASLTTCVDHINDNM